MAIDAGKSYCWALCDDQRKQLNLLPFKRVEHAMSWAESFLLLGADSLAFSKRRLLNSLVAGRD